MSLTGMDLSLRDQAFVLDPAGALVWPARDTLVVADLHLEKGSAFARRGALLPPYDTHCTLDRLEAVLRRWRPTTVVSLGDGFHDRRGSRDLSPELLDRLCRIVHATRWVWVTGNHDSKIALDLGGAAVPELVLDGLVLRHEPTGAAGEIAGHLHPKARVHTRRLSLARPCFVADRERLVLPALGSFTGGLNALDGAISGLFPQGFMAYLLGDARVFGFPHVVLTPDADASLHRLGRA